MFYYFDKELKKKRKKNIMIILKVIRIKLKRKLLLVLCDIKNIFYVLQFLNFYFEFDDYIFMYKKKKLLYIWKNEVYGVIIYIIYVCIF